jgi:hypothetical protein
MKYRKIIFILIFSLTAAAGCKTLMSYTNILKCDFKMKSVTDTRLAGINIHHIKSYKDLNFAQIGKLSAAYLSGNIPLSFDLNLEAKNPNPAEATLAKFDWILLIDDIQTASGTNTREYQIPPNEGLQTIPVSISVNLLDVLNQETKNSILNFGFNLADAGDKPTRIGFKIKPTINLNNIPITYPGYIELGTEFGSAQ